MDPNYTLERTILLLLVITIIIILRPHCPYYVSLRFSMFADTARVTNFRIIIIIVTERVAWYLGLSVGLSH